MKLTEKINFRQPKYMLPVILYFPVLFCGFFVFKLFNTEKADIDDSKLETTEYYNDKLPDANIKGDGIGNKYTNMLNDFGKIKDQSAVENIERGGEDTKEEYASQYNDAELAAMDKSSQAAQASLERLRQLQQQMKEQQERDNPIADDRTGGNTEEEEQTLEDLRKALENARMEGQRKANAVMPQYDDPSAKDKSSRSNITDSDEEHKAEVTVTTNENAVTEISEEAKPEEAVKKPKETSDFFNTIATNEPESKLIRAIVDEDIKAVDGSRVRLRLLDDIDIGERTIKSGTYLYCTMSGFGQQRVKGTVKSVLVDDELVKVNLSLYDTDGLEGLYVPKSTFRETSQDIASGAISQNMNMSNGMTGGSSLAQWGMQAVQNAYQKTANAISKNIKKNKVKVKYGTQVYLINSKEKSKK